MARHIINYTTPEDMQSVNEGIFCDSSDIEIGDRILDHRKSKFTGERILRVVTNKVVAYWFNGQPVYDYEIGNRGTLKSCLKHVSMYDRLIR